MFIGSLYFECYIPGAQSLKHKRQALRSFKDRLKSKFNVAVAEVDHQDKWQRSAIAVVTVSGNHTFVENLLDEIERFALTFPSLSATVQQREVL
ncbi:MAG: DUF503 domain-containing protein [Planctomycetota bacterium]|nr:DUF503 domain-containing protein [Planctomycetota bacterium]